MPRLLLLAILALAIPSARADQGPPVFKSGAELVLVDVVVTDGKGALVRGLTSEDFLVYEDGDARPIASFEAIDRPAVAGSLAVAPEPMPAVATNAVERPERATLVVVFDELHLSPIATEHVRSRLEDAWKALGPADVLLVSTAGGGNWMGRLPGDEESLQAALLRFKGARMPEKSGVISDYEAFLIAARHDENALIEIYRRYIEAGLIMDPQVKLGRNFTRPDEVIEVKERKKDLPSIGRSMITAEAEERWAGARQRQAATLARLTHLLNGLAGRGGRKAVILVSEGFVHDPAIPEHRGLVEAARRARAAIHVIDPRNPGALSHEVESVDLIDIRDLHQAAARVPRESEGSDALANATGGRIVRSVQALPATLGRLGDELRTYYLLGYEPPAGRADGRYHKLRVALKRPGLRLEARPGYYALAPESRRAARDAPATVLRNALASPFDAGGLPVQLAGFVLGRGPKGGSLVRLVGEVDASTIAVPETVDALFELVPQGDASAKQAALSAPLAKAAGGPVRLEREFEVPPGVYQARLVVRERGGDKRVGSVRQALSVLPVEAFRVTTPILSDVLQDQAPLARAERRFEQGATLHCVVQVLGGSGRPVQAGAVVQSAEGREVLRIPDSAIASIPPSRRWSIPLAGLAAGRYELVISLTDEGTREVLTSRERFVVVPTPKSGTAD
jgi:VWFA-related protein